MKIVDTDYLQNVSYKDDVPMLTYFQIENIAHQVLKEKRSDCLIQCEPIPVEKIMEFSFDLQIDALKMIPDGSILGQTYFQDREDQFYVEDGLSSGWKKVFVHRKTVVLDPFLYEHEPQRRSFTEAHELGHWIFHQLFYTQNEKAAARTRSLRDNYAPYQPRTPIEWTEWQADCFAGCFLLPREIVRPVVKEYLNGHKLHYSQLLNFVDPIMRSRFIELSEMLAKRLGVSRDCARIRLEKLFNVRFPTRKH